ncbi:MAG: DUF721 domain-containing protein [Pseudomonadota bacterium]
MAKNGGYERRGGFKRASKLLEKRIRNAGEARGFAVTRLLTHWPEIVGEATARTVRPVNVSYSKGGLGATLTLLTTAAQAPMLQMELPKIREKVNACYGYNAIARIRITQTAPTGFAEGQAQFAPAPKAEQRPDPALAAKAEDAAKGVENDTLRQALTALGKNVMRSSKRTST